MAAVTAMQVGRDSRMELFRQDGKFCDFIIRVGGSQFSVHKVVMAANSEYFDAMFSTSMIETTENEVALEDIDPETMNQVIKFCYKLEIKLDEVNVNPILEAAHRLQMDELVKTCGSYLHKNLNQRDCLRTLVLARTFNMPELKEGATLYCASNFTQFERADFIGLDADCLAPILASDDFNADESEVLSLVLDWVAHSSSKRESHLETLLRHVKFDHLTADELIEFSNPLELSPGLKGHLYNAMRNCIKRDLLGLAVNCQPKRKYQRERYYQ